MSADDQKNAPKKSIPSGTLPLHRVQSEPSDSARPRVSRNVPLHTTTPAANASSWTTSSSNDSQPTRPDSNILRIKAGTFSMELEGDSDFIYASYSLMRHHILTRLRDTLQQHTARDENQASQIAKRAANKQGGGFIWVYVCHPLYNKVHVVSREALKTSPLGGVIDPSLLNKIYVQRKGLGKLESLVGASKTLWSELTTEGRERLKRAKS